MLSMRGRRKRFVAIGMVAIVMLIVFVLNAGRMLVVDDPQPSDVILVLAGEAYYRPARALELLDRGYGKRVVIDVGANARVYDTSQVELAEKYVRGLPEASSIKICAIQGLSTKLETRDVERCLENESGRRVLLVTSDFHTRRALSIFRHEIRGRSFSIAAAHDDEEFGTRWWTRRQWAKTCLGEWLRTLWWEAVERWE